MKYFKNYIWRRILVETYLIPNEKVIEEYSPVSYRGARYQCAVTNFRILLYKPKKGRLHEIQHRHIVFSSLESHTTAALLGCGIPLLILGFVFTVILDAPALLFIFLR